MRWYEASFGFESTPFPDSPPYSFCILSRDAVEIMLQRADDLEKLDTSGRRPPGAWHAYLRMEGVEALYETVRQRSDIAVLEPIKRQPYGDTEFVVEDPNGYVLVFSELISKSG